MLTDVLIQALVFTLSLALRGPSLKLPGEALPSHISSPPTPASELVQGKGPPAPLPCWEQSGAWWVNAGGCWESGLLGSPQSHHHPLPLPGMEAAIPSPSYCLSFPSWGETPTSPTNTSFRVLSLLGREATSLFPHSPSMPQTPHRDSPPALSHMGPWMHGARFPLLPQCF